MKWSSYILAIMSIFLLVSCSAQKSSTKLQISTGMQFVTTNTTYVGGMVFYGRSSSGEVFSLPVAYNENAQVEIELTKGTWTIGAVGWTSTLMSGPSKCAVHENIKIDTDQKTIELNLNTSDCAKSEFGSSLDGSTFTKPILVTCGTFYNDTKTDPSSPSFLGGDNPDYCNGSGSMIEPEFKIHAKSAVIGLPTLIPGKSPEMNQSLSLCVNLESGWINGLTYQGNSVNFPVKGLPLTIELNDSVCGATEKKKMVEYIFDKGLQDIKYPNFDHLVFDGSIYLLASKSQRGSSYFVKNNFFPRFKCDSSNDRLPCLKTPTIQTGDDRFVQGNRYFFVKEKESNESCTNYLGKTIDDNSTEFSLSRFQNDCLEHDNKFFVQLPSPLTLSCSTGICFSAIFKSGATPTELLLKIQDSGSNELAAYDLLFRTIGYEEFEYPGANVYITNAIDSFLPLKLDNWHGSLTELRMLLAPDKLGGFLANTPNPSGATFSIPISFWDHGFWKSFMITSLQLSTSDATRRIPIPKYIVSKSNPGDTSTLDYYDRKIVIAEILGSPYPNRPIYILNYKNGKQLGMLESLHVNEDKNNHKTRTEKNLLFWNTENDTHNRFENYRFEQEVDTEDNQVLRTRTSFVRAERDDQDMVLNIDDVYDTGGNLRLEEYEFESNFNSDLNSYEARGKKQLLELVSQYALFNAQSFTATDLSSSNDFFTDPWTEAFRYSSQLSSNEKNTAKSPSGEYLVTARSFFNSVTSTYDLKILIKKRGVPLITKTLSVSSLEFISPKITVSNAGQVMVAFVKKTTLSPLAFNLFALVGKPSGSSWIWEDSTGSSPTVFSDSNDVLERAANDIVFDIIDQNPRSLSNSIKTMVFYTHDANTPTNRKLKKLDYDFDQNTPWIEGTFFQIGYGAQPLALEISKPGTTFYVLWHSNSSGSKFEFLSTANFEEVSGISPANINGGTYPSKFHIVKVDEDTVDLLVWGSDGIVLKTSDLGEIAAIGSPAYLSLFENYVFPEQIPYCFSRAVTSSLNLGQLHEAGACDSFNLQTSHADPIKLKFNFDIESLNPSNFETLFNLK
jgi:hypothetical protein